MNEKLDSFTQVCNGPNEPEHKKRPGIKHFQKLSFRLSASLSFMRTGNFVLHHAVSKAKKE